MGQSPQTFARLISPIDTGEFFNAYWDQKSLFISRNTPGYYDDALKIAELDAYLQNQHISPDFLNVLQGGEPCPPEQWTYTIFKVSGSFSARLIDVNKLLNLFNAGATIIIHSSETALPSLAALRKSLESELKFPVQANIYITPPNSQGFAPHFDAHNVLILQIHGTKHWKLYDTPVESPVVITSVKSMDYATRTPHEEVEMQPGDLLYIPRGMVHCARAEKAASVHVTVGPMVKHWSSLLKLLVKRADEDANFRRLLPHGLSSEQARNDFAAEFAQELQKLIARTDFPTLYYAKFVDDQRADNRGRFADVLQLEQLTPDAVVCRRPALDYLIERTEQWIIVRFEGKEISLPLFLENALGKIVAEKPFTVRQIEGIPNDAGKLALVKRFVQAGWLTIVAL